MNSVRRVLLTVLIATYIATVSSWTRREESKPVYTNSWAVKVEGGHSAADSLAAKHGFINKGQVKYYVHRLGLPCVTVSLLSLHNGCVIIISTDTDWQVDKVL